MPNISQLLAPVDFSPGSEVAARYDASVKEPTDDPAEAYADWRTEPRRDVPNPWPLG